MPTSTDVYEDCLRHVQHIRLSLESPGDDIDFHDRVTILWETYDMAAKAELIKINRDTAVSSKQTVALPATSLMADDVQDGSYIFGFEPESKEAEARVFMAESGEANKPEDHKQEPFLMETWLCKRITVIDPVSGQETPAVRTTLFAPNGDMLACSSSGVLLSLDLIRNFRGDGPYNPAIPVIVKETQTRMGRRLYRLVPVDLVPRRAPVAK